MTRQRSDQSGLGVQRYPLIPHVVVSMVIGAVFLLSVLLAAALPALAVVYLVVGFAVRNIVTILVLWAASAMLTIVLYQLISRTYVRTVLRRRVIPKLPGVSVEPEEPH